MNEFKDFGDCWEIAMRREKFPEKVFEIHIIYRFLLD
jgi:hypothetical protein